MLFYIIESYSLILLFISLLSRHFIEYYYLKQNNNNKEEPFITCIKIWASFTLSTFRLCVTIATNVCSIYATVRFD